MACNTLNLNRPLCLAAAHGHTRPALASNTPALIRTQAGKARKQVCLPALVCPRGLMMHACFAHASLGLAVDMWCVNETKANNLRCEYLKIPQTDEPIKNRYLKRVLRAISHDHHGKGKQLTLKAAEGT